MKKTPYLIAGLLAMVFAPSPLKADIRPVQGRSATGLQGSINCANGSSINIDSGTEYIDCTNNRVGISTVTPAYTLEVAGGDTAFSVGIATFVVSGGRVGVGTTSPGNAFHVTGAGSSYQSRFTGNGVSALTIETTNADASARNWGFATASTAYGDFELKQSNAAGGNPISAGTAAMYFDASRKIGIGTTFPQATLEVNGNAQFGSGATKSTFTATGFLNMDIAAAIKLGSRTIAQLLALSPAVAEIYYCNNCSPTKVVVATGTSAGNFAAIDGGAFQ